MSLPKRSLITTNFSSAALRHTSLHQQNKSHQRNKSRSANNQQHQKKLSPDMRFCDICKVSCIGDISFREHLNGQRHLKKISSSTSRQTIIMVNQSDLNSSIIVSGASGSSSCCSMLTPSAVEFEIEQQQPKSQPETSTLEVVNRLQETGKMTATTSTMTTTTTNLVENRVIDSLSSASSNTENIDRLKIASSTSIILRCKLCNVPCVSVDSYRSHLTGSRHTKTARLALTLGNSELPSLVPEIISNNVVEEVRLKVIAEFEAMNIKAYNNNNNNNANNNNGTTDIFNLNNINKNNNNNNNRSSSIKLPYELESVQECDNNNGCASKPIGMNFIEEVINNEGKIICYTCTLCNCRFNDPNAKTMHLKGKKHKIACIKKKNQDSNSSYNNKGDKKQKETSKDRGNNTRLSSIDNPEVRQFSADVDLFKKFSNQIFCGFGFQTAPNDPEPQLANNQLVNIPQYTNGFPRVEADSLIQYAHAQLVAPNSMVHKIHEMINILERASRAIVAFTNKTWMNIQNGDSLREKVTKSEQIDLSHDLTNQLDDQLAEMETQLTDEFDLKNELLCVVRVGALGKGYLLKNDTEVDVILMCNFFPTNQLLDLFVAHLVSLMNNRTGKYFFQMEKNQIGFRLFASEIHLVACQSSNDSNKPAEKEQQQVTAGKSSVSGVENSSPLSIAINVTFTSHLLRKNNNTEDEAFIQGEYFNFLLLAFLLIFFYLPLGMTKILDRSFCLEALTEIRKLHFFRVKHPNYRYFQLVMRVLRNIFKIRPWRNIPLFVRDFFCFIIFSI